MKPLYKPLYIRKTVVPYQSLADLVEDTSDKPFTAAGTYNQRTGATNDRNVRSTSVKAPKPEEWFDINGPILTMLESFGEDPNEFYVKEYNLLEYQKFDKFVKHRDRIKTGYGMPEREYSTSTIIQMSDNLKGGKFLIWSDDGYMDSLDLQVGETIMFSSDTQHEITEVEEGVRLVLVAWIYKKNS